MKIRHEYLDTLPVRRMKGSELMNLLFEIIFLFFIGLAVLIALEVLLIMADYMGETDSLLIFRTGQIAILILLIVDPIAFRPRLGDLFSRRVLEWKDAEIHDLYDRKPRLGQIPWRMRLSDPTGHYILNLENRYEVGVRYKNYCRFQKGDKVTLVVGARSKSVMAVYNALPEEEA